MAVIPASGPESSAQASSMKTLIVGFTPYHSHVAARIIDETEGQIYCAFTKVWPDTQKPYRKIGGVQRNLLGSWLNVIMTCHFFLLLNWWRWTNQKFQAFIPHPSHILTNAVFFLPPTRRTIFLYEDGLLNYHDAPTSKNTVGWKLRWISWLLGFPYRHYTGHLSGCDASAYDGAYLSQPLRAVRRNRLGTIRKLNFTPSLNPPRPFTIVFLDQDTTAYLTDFQRDDCLRKLFEMYPADQYQYIYKPHHDYASSIRLNMKELSGAERAMPAEALLDIVAPSHVVSFYSSALMNIKNSRPHIQCLSIAAHYVTISQDGVQRALADVFREMDIECLKQHAGRAT